MKAEIHWKYIPVKSRYRRVHSCVSDAFKTGWNSAMGTYGHWSAVVTSCTWVDDTLEKELVIACHWHEPWNCWSSSGACGKQDEKEIDILVLQECTPFPRQVCASILSAGFETKLWFVFLWVWAIWKAQSSVPRWGICCFWIHSPVFWSARWWKQIVVVSLIVSTVSALRQHPNLVMLSLSKHKKSSMKF